MSRGSTIKQQAPERLTLLRPMITRRYEFTVEHDKCCGCEICATVCPREAIKMLPSDLVAGRLARKPRVDIDPTLCSFCGECVAMCPTHAMAMTVNGQPEIPVIKGEAFPYLIRTHKVSESVCEATTDVAYLENCPAGAISAELSRDAEGQVTAVKNVAVDKRACINCTRCMEEGPRGAFTVVKPYEGRVFLKTSLCPTGCQACADVCPTNTITYDGDKVAIDQRFCLFCGACQKVCPVAGAVRIVRTGFVHTPVQSGAWAAALDKLVSFLEVSREYGIKSQQKRRQVVINGLRVQGPAADGEAAKEGKS